MWFLNRVIATLGGQNWDFKKTITHAVKVQLIAEIAGFSRSVWSLKYLNMLGWCDTMSMSHAVTPEDLRATAAPYGHTPFLLYVGSNGTVRANHVAVSFTETSGEVLVSGFGRGVAKSLTPSGILSLLWPAHPEAEFSLIADGTGSIDGSGADDLLVLTITSAVLHRPAPAVGPSPR